MPLLPAATSLVTVQHPHVPQNHILTLDQSLPIIKAKAGQEETPAEIHQALLYARMARPKLASPRGVPGSTWRVTI